jgi:hypothetical protein
MPVPENTSAEALDRYAGGTRTAAGKGDVRGNARATRGVVPLNVAP